MSHEYSNPEGPFGRYLHLPKEELMAQMPSLPVDAKARKAIPLATGCIDYFPLALAAVAELSRIGNDKHNPGQPLHWSRDKSNDHADCLLRHFVERGKMDTSSAEPVRHSTQMVWRALALLQLELEAAAEVKKNVYEPIRERAPVHSAAWTGRVTPGDA